MPLTSRNHVYGHASGTFPMPDRITIYRLPICRMCRQRGGGGAGRCGVTVVHEVAHHFGIDDARLDELGWA